MKKRHSADKNHLSTVSKPANDRSDSSAAAAQTDVPVAPTEDTQVRKRIAEAAYYRSEKRCFSPGLELADWLAAEAEITGCAVQRDVSGADLH